MLTVSILATVELDTYRDVLGPPYLFLELISLVSKVSFACTLFSFFQSIEDSGGSTVGLLALT